MLWMAAGKRADICGQTVDHSLGSFVRARAERTDHPLWTKFVSVGVERFGDAIGVKHEAIIAFEGHGKIAGYPIEHVPTVNSEGHSRRLEFLDFAGGRAIEQRCIMPTTRESYVVVLMIENEVSHADEHVLFNIGIELAIDLPQNFGGRLTEARLGPQDATADRHDQRRRHAFTGNVGNHHSKMIVVHLDVIKVITAHLAGGQIQARDVESFDRRRLLREQDPLNVARDLEIMIEPLLFVRLRIDDRIVEGEG